ncbi:MAG: hypothetical protein JWM10_2884 [Myxococcaceae bacterium]|nr:hypothetical protein [Myxococcaceae bacterium]
MSPSTATHDSAADASATLLSRLFIELFQTEESAFQHPRIEAERLGDVSPAHAMAAVSAHAARSLEELRALARTEKLATSTLGARVGDFFSAVRDVIADRTLDREKTYRGTLLGMQHGLGVVTLLEATAMAHGRTAIAAWCWSWLAERRPLVEQVNAALAWFAANPDRALEGATARMPSAQH